MNRLRDKLLPTDAIRWIAEPAEDAGRSGRGDKDLAVLDDAVAWCDSRDEDNTVHRVPLKSIGTIDAEPAAARVTLVCDREVHVIEGVIGGGVDEFARATGRPARIWRERALPAARLERTWQLRVGVLMAVGYFLGLWSLDAVWSAFWGNVSIAVLIAFHAAFTACLLIILVLLPSGLGKLLHLPVDASPEGRDRADPIRATSQLRGDGEELRGSRPGAFRRWILRLAYGDYEFREAEYANLPADGTRPDWIS